MANYILSAPFNNILTNLNQFVFFYNLIHLLTYQKSQKFKISFQINFLNHLIFLISGFLCPLCFI